MRVPASASARSVLILLGLLIVARLIGMGLLPLMDTTEARYAEIFRKMLEFGDWVTPWYDNGLPFWGEPPLSFWHTAASFKLFGVNEFAARLPNFLCAAVVVVLGIPGNLSSELNSGADKIPAFSVGFDDGTALRELIERGGAKLQMKLAVDTLPGLRDASVWGELPGTTDEDIIVMAHHDAYFQGALDNASGMATMVGLAEYFSTIPKAQRRRTIKFVTTSGHHNGSLGVKWMHDNKDTFLAKTALLLNCEHVSVTQTYYWGPNFRRSDQTDARRWWVFGSDKLAETALNAYRTFGVAVYHEMEPNASGDMGQASLDAPSVQMIESPAFYHTDHDTPEVVPVSGLEAVGRAYAKLIDEVNKLDRRQLIGAPAAKPTAGQR